MRRRLRQQSGRVNPWRDSVILRHNWRWCPGYQCPDIRFLPTDHGVRRRGKVLLLLLLLLLLRLRRGQVLLLLLLLLLLQQLQLLRGGSLRLTSEQLLQQKRVPDQSFLPPTISQKNVKFQFRKFDSRIKLLEYIRFIRKIIIIFTFSECLLIPLYIKCVQLLTRHATGVCNTMRKKKGI